MMRTVYQVIVEHPEGEEPILFVSDGAQIVGVYLDARLIPKEEA